MFKWRRLLPVLRRIGPYKTPVIALLALTCASIALRSDVGAAVDPRSTLTAVPTSPQLNAALDAFRAADPAATFRFLRGHVDSFTTHPKGSIPSYALPILNKYGLSTVPVVPPTATTSSAGSASTVSQPRVVEDPAGKNIGFSGPDDQGVSNDSTTPITEAGTAKTTWYPQAGETAVKEILAAFLKQNSAVFEVDAELLAAKLPNLSLTKYGVGAHFRRAAFEQNIANTPLLSGKTIVLFDLNWNVIVISRQLVTGNKLTLAAGTPIDQATAKTAASSAVASRYNRSPGTLKVTSSRLGIDAIRNLKAWEASITDTKTRDVFSVILDAMSGEVLNISDNTARFSDAQVDKWDYPAGDMDKAVQSEASGVYTYDDNTLVHDFFYIVNDDRNNGGTGACTATTPQTDSTPLAYGTTMSAITIRPTLRSDRDFTLWEPSDPKGSFGESHVYYWAREYMLWQKQALVDLGVLTLGNFNNYKKTLIVVNACDSGGGKFDSTFAVSTLDNVGENLPAILLPDRCRSGNASCVATDYASTNSGDLYTFEGSGGYHFPGVIHHELNHFVLIKYFDVANSLDCTGFDERQYFQEGGLGRALAQMYWHHRYGVGYFPDTTNKLFRSSGASGRVHNPADASTLNTLSAYTCGTDDGDPYSWGSPVHQPLWKIYHGQKVSGVSLVSTARPATDLDMLKSTYYAAEMAAASSFADRWEVANRFMEFWELFSTALPTTKTDWCEVWGEHGLSTFIAANSCN